MQDQPSEKLSNKQRRQATEAKIITAVETLLLNDGFTQVGINSIARTAGCDKVLIYRYFDGFEGLLARFAEQANLWWQCENLFDFDPAQHKLEETLLILLKKHVDILRQQPITLEIMAWEMSEQNTLTNALSQIRAEQGMELVKTVRHHYANPNIDIGGILGVFGAAINFLLIRTRNQSSQYTTEEWWRLQQTLESLLLKKSL